MNTSKSDSGDSLPFPLDQLGHFMEGDDKTIELQSNPLCIIKQKFPVLSETNERVKPTNAEKYAYIPGYNVCVKTDSLKALKMCRLLFSGYSTRSAIYWWLLAIPSIRWLFIPYVVKVQKNQLRDLVVPSTGALVRLYDFKQNEIVNVIKPGFTAEKVWKQVEYRERKRESGVSIPKIYETNWQKGYFTEAFLSGNRFSATHLSQSDTAIVKGALDALMLSYEGQDTVPVETYCRELEKRLQKNLNAVTIEQNLTSRLSQLPSMILQVAEKHIQHVCITHVHGDFHLENIIQSNEGDLFIIDWEYATRANLLHDASNMAIQAYINYNTLSLIEQLRTCSGVYETMPERYSEQCLNEGLNEYIHASLLIYVLEMLVWRTQDERYTKNPPDLERVVTRVLQLHQKLMTYESESAK